MAPNQLGISPRRPEEARMLIRYLIDDPLTVITFIGFILFFVLFLTPLMRNDKKWARALREWGKA